MATANFKKIGKQNIKAQSQHTNAWEVMKPFVHFGIKATAAIAHTLIWIVKHIPKPNDHQQERNTNKKIIKI